MRYLIILFCFAGLFDVSGRTWENREGQRIDAEFLEFVNDTSIRIKLSSNGRIYTYSIADLSKSDQTYLAELKKKIIAEKAAAKLADRRARWTEDLEEAEAEAKEFGLPILYLFTGSDWCGYCIQLEDRVFSRREFREYADKNLVLLKLDFPRGSQRRSIERQNQTLKNEFNVSGFPTVFLANVEGDSLGKIGGYGGWSPEEYIKRLEDLRK